MKLSDTWADLKPSRFLKQEDVATPVTYTIKSLTRESVTFQDKADIGTIVRFEETEREVFAKTALVSQLAELFPAGPGTAVGQKVELFQDKSVMMGAKKVGGLRFRTPSQGSAAPF
jgi:hypothetical protein